MAATYEPHPRRSTRSWTNNGVHYTVDTTHYASPGFSFHAVSGGANNLFDDFGSPGVSRRQTMGTGLLGNALGLLGDLASVHHNGNQLRSSRGRRAEAEEASEEDDEIIHVGSHRASRPKSMFGRIVDRIAEKGSRPRRQTPAKQSPPRRPRTRDRQDRSYPSESQEPVYQESRRGIVDDDAFQYVEDDRQGRPSRLSRSNSDESNASLLAALEDAVQYHAAEVRKCKKQLERASRQQRVHSGHLQALLDELKSNEMALANAAHNLEAATVDATRNSFQHRAHSQNRSSRSRHQPIEAVVGDGMPMPNAMPNAGYAAFARQRPSHALFGDFGFGDMDPLAERMFAQHFATFGGVGMRDSFAEFFAMPQGAPTSSHRKQTRTAPSSGAGRQRPANSLHAQPPPPRPTQRPPPTVLTPDECRRLFKMYSERWAALSNTDPDVPYPARGLHAIALLGRDTLWAPQVKAHPSTWSDETVIKANVQAFFLNLVGLVPKYTEAGASGKVEMGFDKSRATAEQVKQLLHILKKERMKWHSDRLGNRNGGMPGRNEDLQQDVRARAVFHAICELMESAQ